LITYLSSYTSKLVSEAALKAIAEPRRREILRLVWSRELPAGEIATHFEISRPAISKHLRVLREAGLVDERRDGTHRLYRARPEGVADARRVLESFWDESLSAIKRSAEDDVRRRRT
jgi:DNA-binding transcriptional ArsR family regulator